MTLINDFELKVATEMVRLALQPAPCLYFGYGFLTVCGVVIGKPLSVFAKPDSPFLSNVVRALSLPTYKVSKVSASVGVLTQVVLVSMTYLGGGSLVYLYSLTKPHLFSLVGGSFLGLCVSLPISWRFLPAWAMGQGLTDAKAILTKLRKLKNYNPLDYLNLQKGCFVGLDYLSKKPVYIPWPKINESHTQYLGASGSVKNIGIVLMAFQCILKNQGLFYFCPKGDYRSPSVVQKAAKLAKKNFHFINLNLDQPPQFNLLAGCSEFEIEELFITGFDLQSSGGDGDFYRGKDQDSALLAGQIAIRESASCIPKLFNICSKVPEIYENENFWRKFKKLASIPAINTIAGLHLEKAILGGDVIYVVGSCDNERIKMLQKMILVRVMQIIKKRDRATQTSPILVVLDEVKHLISPVALTSLGVVRDFNSHFGIAHQGMGDLAESPLVNEKAAFGAVITNTTLKFILKNNDVDFAKRMAETAGQRTVFTNNSSKEIDTTSDFRSSNGGWSETKDFKIPAEIFANLPVPSDREGQPSTAVLFGIGEAKIIYTSPIILKNNIMPSILKADCYSSDTVSQTSKAEDLI